MRVNCCDAFSIVYEWIKRIIIIIIIINLRRNWTANVRFVWIHRVEKLLSAVRDNKLNQLTRK